MNGDYPWTDSGLRLLDIIQGIVQREGGRNQLAVKIMREDKDHYMAQVNEVRRREIGEVQKIRRNGFNKKRDQIIIDHWQTHTLQEIADMAGGMHLSTISIRGYDLGLPKRSRGIHHLGQKPKPVIIEYPKYEHKCWSITEAAKKLQVSNCYIHKAIKLGYRVKGYKLRFAEQF